MPSRSCRLTAPKARSPPQTQHNRALRIIAEVHRPRRHQNPYWPWRNQHSAAHAFERRTARSTASTSRASAPPGTRTLMVPITISMAAERRSSATLLGCADSTGTTGTEAGISSHQPAA